MRTTIKDVAREAKVSFKTVSRVLNGERYVGSATRARVEAAMATLHFRPNLAARALAGPRAFQIGLICDNPSPYYVYEMQAGVRARCDTEGVRMLAQPYDRAADMLVDLVEALIDTTRTDGLILTPPASDDEAVLALLERRGVRTVRVSPGVRHDWCSASFIDNHRGAEMATAHLIALDHRRIGCIAGDPRYATSAQRTAGFRAAMAAAGLVIEEALIVEGRYNFASGAAAAETLLARADPPSAVFAASDDMAAGVLAAAHRHAMSLPGDLSVVGFGDDSLAGFVWPPLTTVRQPARALGWNAADLLFAPADATPEARELGCELVLRASTAWRNR